MTARDDRRFEDLQREVSALRTLLEVTRTELAELRESEPPSTPVGLAAAARIARCFGGHAVPQRRTLRRLEGEPRAA